MNRPRWNCIAPVTACAVSLLVGGCQLVGVAVENYRKDATKTVDAESTVLEGKSFAAIVVADRGIQGDFPAMVDDLTATLTARLSSSGNNPRAGGFIPANDVLAYIYSSPAWTYKSKAELAEALGGVDRIVILEIMEYRLHDPGNPYVWDGMASGVISVYDPSSPTPELAIFERTISIRYPDETGKGPNDTPAALVYSQLGGRLIDRASWPFYDHKEPYYPKY
ncbi:hypothetical protein PHYC_00205 [Phycisphaerales bacterium]|nr:hypothetical protein PHYC_00205 [Phycisphaerales bacterium]